MNKKIPIGMLAFFAGVLAVYMVIQVASAGYRFGQFLAHPEPEESRAPSAPAA